MSTVREITPRTGKEISVTRAMKPFTHSVEEFFENFFPRRWMETFMEPYAWKRPEFEMFERPLFALDMIDHDQELVVRAELPGVRKEDVEITIAGDYLTVEAQREFKEKEEKETFYRTELGYGKLLRTVYLPMAVETDTVKAELIDGILTIVLPKVEAVKRHTVKVA